MRFKMCMCARVCIHIHAVICILAVSTLPCAGQKVITTIGMFPALAEQLCQ